MTMTKEKLTLKINDYSFIVKQGKIEDHFDKERNEYIYKSIINVNIDGKNTRFNFFGSINDYQNNKKDMNIQELAFALYCFVSDAESYFNNSFQEFCAEFGYCDDSIKALKIYKACKRTYDKLTQYVHDGDFCDILNHLQENYNC